MMMMMMMMMIMKMMKSATTKRMIANLTKTMTESQGIPPAQAVNVPDTGGMKGLVRTVSARPVYGKVARRLLMKTIPLLRAVFHLTATRSATGVFHGTAPRLERMTNHSAMVVPNRTWKLTSFIRPHALCGRLW